MPRSLCQLFNSILASGSRLRSEEEEEEEGGEGRVEGGGRREVVLGGRGAAVL